MLQSIRQNMFYKLTSNLYITRMNAYLNCIIGVTNIIFKKIANKDKYKMKKLTIQNWNLKKQHQQYLLQTFLTYSDTYIIDVIQCPNEIERMYRHLKKLWKDMDTISTSITITAGEFNAKIGKKK